MAAADQGDRRVALRARSRQATFLRSVLAIRLRFAAETKGGPTNRACPHLRGGRHGAGSDFLPSRRVS